jgi:hypothetical protein
MKKFALFTILLVIISITVEILPVSALLEYNNAGEKLKSLGIVKGYKAYGLREEKAITEGEFLALVARVLKAKEKTEISDVIKPVNAFDEFANTIYRIFIRFKRFVVRNYYNTLALNPKYEPVKGIDQNSWFFEDALYLKMKGFEFPEEFSQEKAITSKEMFEYLINALNLNSQNFVKAPEGFSQEEMLKITLLQQGLLDDGFLEKTSVTRGEAFNIILFLYEKE